MLTCLAGPAVYCSSLLELISGPQSRINWRQLTVGWGIFCQEQKILYHSSITGLEIVVTSDTKIIRKQRWTCLSSRSLPQSAMEYSIPSIPSLIWESPGAGGSLYLGEPYRIEYERSPQIKKVITGGYKAAINTDWIQKSNVRLIVSTAKGMESILGPKFERGIVKRKESCPDTEIHELLMDDDLQQKLDIEELRQTASRILASLKSGSSVLVHCMQGKCRSSTVVVATLCLEWRRPVMEVLAFIKEKWNMAEPNINFMTQLIKMEANGEF